MKLGRFLVLLIALMLTGCGLRIDTPPPTVAPPSAAELARDSAARELYAVANYTGPELSGPLARFAANAHERADSLGGVWQDCREDPACATLPPEQISGASSPEDIAARGQLVLAYLDEMTTRGDANLASLAASMLPLVRVEIGHENPRGYQQHDWTHSPALLTTLAWGMWQLDAAAARDGDAGLSALADELREAASALTSTSNAAEIPVFQTESATGEVIITELATKLANQLPEFEGTERLAIVDLLQLLTEVLTERGAQVPAAWLTTT
ncbi:MAG: hypothetical protein Q4Q03_05830 [Bowdeniella nasicola]|nr:hypothetical protein [Bowdeniella nasicola]